MYVEKKKIKGKDYYYLKISARKGDMVKTKTAGYLGKAPMSKKQIEKKVSEIPKKKIELAKKELEKSFDSLDLKFLSEEQLNYYLQLSKYERYKFKRNLEKRNGI